MKVCTDACLFGAWLAEKFSNFSQSDLKILDIGTGTGLLSLMLAQKNPSAVIDAVEIEEAAAMQAGDNFQQSPWKERLNLYCSSIQQFNQSTNQLYDFVCCNPPFFENDLKSSNVQRNLALHSTTLSLEELLVAIKINLKEDGSFAVLLPFHRTNYFEELAVLNNFFLTEKVLVQQTPEHNCFRSMLYFSRKQTPAVEKTIVIKSSNKEYTPEFIHLLKDYYLYL